uniref:Uncharacterized protein n=1 Tax=Sphaerodactylus townsendi TaxID=933632 RepID=A0ACB8FLK7_9SAUR
MAGWRGGGVGGGEQAKVPALQPGEHLVFLKQLDALYTYPHLTSSWKIPVRTQTTNIFSLKKRGGKDPPPSDGLKSPPQKKPLLPCPHPTDSGPFLLPWEMCLAMPKKFLKIKLKKTPQAWLRSSLFCKGEGVAKKNIQEKYGGCFPSGALPAAIQCQAPCASGAFILRNRPPSLSPPPLFLHLLVDPLLIQVRPLNPAAKPSPVVELGGVGREQSLPLVAIGGHLFCFVRDFI